MISATNSSARLSSAAPGSVAPPAPASQAPAPAPARTNETPIAKRATPLDVASKETPPAPHPEVGSGSAPPPPAESSNEVRPQPARVAAPHTPVRLHDLADALPRSVRVAIDEGGREARIRLAPPELGEIHIRLAVSGQHVSAELSAERGDVQRALEGMRADLQESFSRVGLTLEKLEIRATSGSMDSAPQDGGFLRRDTQHAPESQAARSESFAGTGQRGGESSGGDRRPNERGGESLPAWSEPESNPRRSRRPSGGSADGLVDIRV